MATHGQEQFIFGKGGIKMSRKHVLIDKTTNVASEIMQWGDDRDFPSNITIDKNKKLITVGKGIEVTLGDLYDPVDGSFSYAELPIIPPEPTEIELLQDKVKILTSELKGSQIATQEWITANFVAK